jgi:type II secretory pathway component GspD/PulD (secretin)
MLIKGPAAGFSILLAVTVVMGGSARAAGLHLEKDAQGSVKAFNALNLPLSDFIREYERVSGKVITVNGAWDQALKGSVTLFLNHPLKPDELTELTYRVLNDNAYAVIDAPADNGWIIESTRDARDLAIPIFESHEVPDTARLVTAIHTLKYADAEDVARMARSFMPANSRIIPATSSQVFITDTGSNIRKLISLISLIDTEDSAKKLHEHFGPSHFSSPRVCGEQRIEKLVVEKLEVQNVASGASGPSIPNIPGISGSPSTSGKGAQK